MGHERICGKGDPGRGNSSAKALRGWSVPGMFQEEHGGRCSWKSVSVQGGQVSKGRRGEVQSSRGGQ